MFMGHLSSLLLSQCLGPVSLDQNTWQKQGKGRAGLLSWKGKGPPTHQVTEMPSMHSRVNDVRMQPSSLFLPLFPYSIKLELLVCNLCKLCDLFLVMGLNLTPFTLTFLNHELLVPKGIQCCLQLTQLIAQSRHLMWHVASWKHNWLLRWRNIHFRVEFVMMELLVQSKPGMWMPGLYIKISALDSWIKLQTQSLPFSLSP